jgi:hypothetical protein
MLRKLLAAAAVAVTACTLPVPAAHAATVRSGRGFDTVAPNGGDTYTGAVYGYATFDDGGTHSLRCSVAVDTVERASSPAASGSVLVLTAGRVTFDADPLAAVELCTEIDGVTVSCGVSVGPYPRSSTTRRSARSSRRSPPASRASWTSRPRATPPSPSTAG